MMIHKKLRKEFESYNSVELYIYQEYSKLCTLGKGIVDVTPRKWYFWILSGFNKEIKRHRYNRYKRRNIIGSYVMLRKVYYNMLSWKKGE